MTFRLPALMSTLACVVSLATPAVVAAAEPDSVDLLVRRDPGLSAAERSAVRADAGVTHERPLLLADAEVVSAPSADADDALAALRADPDVRWAVRDQTLHAQATTCAAVAGVAQPSCPTDPFLPLQWSLENAGQTYEYDDDLGFPVTDTGTADADMDVFAAWGLGATGAGVEIAVLDTGVDTDHPDLAGRLDLSRAKDFVSDDAVPEDGEGHGTHVTGTIVAGNGNGGVSGVAPDATAIPLRVLDDAGDGSFADILDAMAYAGQLGVPIANLSLGGVTSAEPAADVARAYPGTLYVVAAGNDDVNLELTEYAPCQADAANVLCVGASDNDDARASFSNYGTTAVDLYAPGDVVASTYLNGGWAFLSGTSMATPNVAGVAALVLQRAPTLSAAALATLLRATVDPKPGLPSVTGGRANAAAAIAALPEVVVPAAPPAPPAPEPATPASEDPGTNPADTVRAPVAPAASPPPAAPAPAVLPAPRAVPATTVAAPTLRSLAVKVTKRRARLTLDASAATTATIHLQRRACAKGRCSWRPVFTTTRSVSAGRTVYTATKKLSAGRHRAVVSVGAGAPRTTTFTVR